MNTFVAAKFFTERNGDVNERFQRNACAVDTLPKHISSLEFGENVMIKHAEVPAESHETGSAKYGQLVFWTTFAMMDQAWQVLHSEFLQGRPHEAVAIAARKQKPNWYIDECKRPFGDCRLTVFIIHSDYRQHQCQVAARIAALLGQIPISHAFYASNLEIAQTSSVPAAVRLTQPVHESPSHHLVYVQPFTASGTPLSPENSWLSTASNFSMRSSNSSQNGNTAAVGHVSNADSSNNWRRPARDNTEVQKNANDRSAVSRAARAPVNGSSRGADSTRW